MLRQRLFRLLLGLVVCFCALACTLLYVADEWVEDVAIEQILSAQFDDLITANAPPETAAGSRSTSRYFRPRISGYLPPPLQQLVPGITEDIVLDGQAYLVMVRRLAADDLAYLAYPIGFIEARERWLWAALGLTALMLLLLAAAAADRLSHHVLAPLLRLLDDVRRLDTRERHWRLHDSADDPDLNAIIHALNRRLMEIEQLVERERVFAAAASHELRGPLTVVQSNLQLLDGQDVPPQKSLARMQRATLAMNEMLDALLALSRVQESPVLESLQLDQVLPVIADSLLRDLPQSLQWQMTPVRMAAPPGAVRIVFGNLLRNAVQASPDHAIQIRLSDRAVTIDDAGPGFAPELENHLFEPGFRGREGGSGMGLYIAQQIAQRHRWSLSLRNRPEGGTRAIWHFGPALTEQ